MKKILASIAALAMAATMATSAFAATTLTGAFIWDFEDECKDVVTLNQPK